MSQRGDLRLIGKSVTREEEVGYRRRCRGGEERAYVDTHVEDAECEVALAAVAGIVVKVTHERLHVTFEKAGTQSYQCERTEHGELGRKVGAGRDGKQEIAYEHHRDAYHYRLAVAEPFVGYYTAEEGQKIYGSQKDAENIAGLAGSETELRLYEKNEDRQHGVVSETFAHVSERKNE